MDNKKIFFFGYIISAFFGLLLFWFIVVGSLFWFDVWFTGFGFDNGSFLTVPNIFVFGVEQNITDVLKALKDNLTEDIINFYLWRKDTRVKNTFIGINKAIEIYNWQFSSVINNYSIEGSWQQLLFL